ncbi:MAG TPA: hypothetical protein VL442_08830 [Mucilaginibacter sp.]|jgi:hypothetical protein|nr:hypothetical protein [Mucilaginibacter sp.]
MKKALPGFFILFLFLVLCSCSKKLYTHQQVMQSFHNKDDVFKRFGNPDIKRAADSTEIWIYNRDISGKTPQSVAKTPPVNDTSQTSAAVPQNIYVNFIFDHNENVVGYKSNGVDLSYVQKVSAAHNILNVLGAAAIIIVVVGIDAYSNGDFNF